MDDISLRRDFVTALDAVTPAAPWLRTRVHANLELRWRETSLKQRRVGRLDLDWLIPLVAVLVALSLIIGLIAGLHLLTIRPIPTIPHPGAQLGCPTWGYVPGGGAAPVTLKMTSANVGWAPGDLRTTDGGAHWQDISPNQLRSGEPYLPGQQTAYPPNYTDFFLDSDHAWLVRSFSSDNTCIDHVTVFGTADGGKTWHSSQPIVPKLASTAQPQVAITFLNPNQGWLLLSAFPATQTKLPRFSILYDSTDGGKHWNLVSSAGPPCASVVFSSVSVGWSTCAGAGASVVKPGLWTTVDGGQTWALSNTGDFPAGNCGCPSPPQFFDPNHGVGTYEVQNSDGSVSQDVFSTSDGGLHWQSQTLNLPGGFEPYGVPVDFAGVNDDWVLVSPPGSGKGYNGPQGDWLYHSRDDGASWQLVQRFTPITDPTALDFIDSQRGFALQPDANNNSGTPTLYSTSDGGHTWTSIQPHLPAAAGASGSPGTTTKSPSPGSVIFASLQVGWELSVPPDRLRTVIFRTADGGGHWRLWGVAPEAAPPVGVNANSVLLNDSVNLLSSSDGVTWASHPLPEPGANLSFLPDLQHGWAYAPVPTNNPPPGKGGPPAPMGVWATVDGGATWRLVAHGLNLGDGSGPIAFWSTTTGAILQGGTLYLTHDSGLTWHVLSVGNFTVNGPAQDSPPIMFDASHGVLPILVFSGAPTMYLSQTSDGGLTWSKAVAETACGNCQAAIAFLDAQHWLGWNGSQLLVSDDGGQTFRPDKTTNPSQVVSGVELIAGVPGAAIVFEAGVFASETLDYGAHWKAIGLANVYTSYSGFQGVGGWNQACQCMP